MRIMTKMLAGAAGLAAIAAAAPTSAQYYPYRYNSYGYGALNTNVAAQQCTAAVQNRLYNRTSLGSILGSLVGIPTGSYGRVLSVTRETPTRNGMRIRGLASSGRYASNGYGPYGVGAYGALGYGYNSMADLSWRCDVDYNGYVRNVDINRR
ncbi:MAG TPA: hypothetical protein VFW39_11125 [Sphingomicrobium sp.]|nr:hypothetical protein [Sphingomicrobium sp.]